MALDMRSPQAGDVFAKRLRANKDYLCWGCGGSIRRGETYVRELVYTGRHVFSRWGSYNLGDEHTVCVECSSVMLFNKSRTLFLRKEQPIPKWASPVRAR